MGAAVKIVASDVDRDCVLLDAFQRLGAEVVLHGAEWNDADERARELGSLPRAAYVEMFDDPLIMGGHASLVEELHAARAGVAPGAIVLAVGGGGLLSGVCEGLERVGWPTVPVYACQSEHCNLLDAALSAGKPTPTRISSADGHDLGSRAVAQAALDWSTARGMDVRSTLVSDASALKAVATFLDEERVMVEPLCAVALASLYESPELYRGMSSVVVVVCGGSLVTLDDVNAWRSRSTSGDSSGPRV